MYKEAAGKIATSSASNQPLPSDWSQSGSELGAQESCGLILNHLSLLLRIVWDNKRRKIKPVIKLNFRVVTTAVKSSVVIH